MCFVNLLSEAELSFHFFFNFIVIIFITLLTNTIHCCQISPKVVKMKLLSMQTLFNYFTLFTNVSISSSHFSECNSQIYMQI